MTTARLLGIDVFRGATLALMIVVNMSISEDLSYAPLLHARWHGLTLTDLVFPAFLLAVGASMSLSLRRFQGADDAAFFGKVATRTAVIFGLGFLLYWFPFLSIDGEGTIAVLPLAKTRMLGVLQRIALCYCIAALVTRYVGSRGLYIFAAAALTLNWWVLATFGDYTLSGNAALRLDKWLVGEDHLYRGEGIPFDPEGLLGTLPATVNVLAGYLAGRALLVARSAQWIHIRLVLVGAGLVLLAHLLDPWQPINKKLWTTTYAIGSAGYSLMALAVVDQLSRKAVWPRVIGFFTAFGKNTLFIYLVAELGMSLLWLVKVGESPLFMVLFQWLFVPWAGDKTGSLAFALTYLAACWLVARMLDTRRIYIRI